jgi:hypothetical protein
MGVRLPLMVVLVAALCGCREPRFEVLGGIHWTFEGLAPAIAVGLESDRSFARAEQLFGARCGACHGLGDGRGGLAAARRQLSVDEWLHWVTGGAGSHRCRGCGEGRSLDGLEQGAVLDLMAILVHGANEEDPAFQGSDR